MNDQMNKARLLELLYSKRAEWTAILAEVPEARMIESEVAGHWSVKDLVAHINYYERWYADRLHEQLRGETYTPTELDGMHFLTRNDVVYEQIKDRPLAEILAASQKGFQDLIQGVQGNSEAFLIQPQQLPGAPEPVVIWQMMRDDIYDHYAEHIASIKAWLQSDRSAQTAH